MKKIIKNVIFYAFCVILCSQSLFCEDFMHANSNVISCNPIILLKLEPQNSYYLTIEKEINIIKNSNYSSDIIDLEQCKNLAPELYQGVYNLTQNLSTKAKIEMPKLKLYVGTSEKSYNASATNAVTKIITTKTITNTKKNKTSVNEKVEKNYTLTLGEGLLRLLLWNKDGYDLLQSIIAHEIGHMYYCHLDESKESESQADAKAIELIGSNKKEKLVQAINMVTLAGHFYNILTSNAYLFKLNLDDINYLIRIISNNIIEEFCDLEDLGKSSSHTKFGYVLTKVFQDALDGFFDSAAGLTTDNLVRIYERLQQACENVNLFMGSSENAYQLTMHCKNVEEYSNKFYSPITHPAPLERMNYIRRCA